VYPADAEELDEMRDWDAPPHRSEASFGWAKRVGEIQARSYFEHYGFPVAIVRPTNPYGPHDNFDPERSHVIPALIVRAIAGEKPFKVWGSGRAVRSFIYAKDATRGMLLALMNAADCEPVNLGSPEAVSIADVVRLVLRLAGRDDSEVEFDTSKPDGHPRKVPRIERLRSIGVDHFTSLEDGLRETIDWYQRSRVTAE
jgi:nucleoside-diphosphate-sugar epimerase